MQIRTHLMRHVSLIGQVVRQPWSLVFGIIAGIIVVIIAIWLPNTSFLTHLLFESGYSLSTKLSVFIAGLGAFQTNLSLPNQIIVIFIALLTGLNIALLRWYYTIRKTSDRALGVSSIGTIIGFLGIGCASCGSVILSSLVGIGSATIVTSALPFHGLEFGLFGVILLVYANHTLLKKLANPLICKIPS